MIWQRQETVDSKENRWVWYHIFAPFLIQWVDLTQSEKVVGLLVALCPMLWILGWNYVMVFLPMMLFLWHYWTGQRLQLTRPSWVVFFAFFYQVYRFVIGVITRADASVPRMILGGCTAVSFCFLLWYTESNRIRVRPRVVAWALVILAAEMLLFWLVMQGILGAPTFQPPRTLFAQLTAKGEEYIPGMGNANYLIPYWADDFLPGGGKRFSFFFPYPEDFALVTGLMGLVALDANDAKRTPWLLAASVFLLFLSGTRSNWLIFPFIFVLRYLVIATKQRGGKILLLALGAALSFALLSLPAMTDGLSDAIANLSTSTGNFRQDSTEVRSLIYQRTWESIVDETDHRLWLGRGQPGETVLPGYAPAQVGTHSFILGSLLYRAGLIGLGLFSCFWVGLISKIYQTRQLRPLSALLMLLYLSLTFITMDVATTNFLVLLISVLHTDSAPSVTDKKNNYIFAAS
jgi:hypothetical protein